MELIPIERVYVSTERYRKAFDETKLMELAQSIESVGLLHPIVVRPKNDKYVLIAGERRLRAVQILHQRHAQIPTHQTPPMDKVPYWFIPAHVLHLSGGMTPLEMELDENLRRDDLTWQEVATATKILHEMRQQAEKSWTVKQTAEELGQRGFDSHPTRTAQRIVLADYLEKPEIATAPSEREAIKRLAKELERGMQQLLYDQQGEITFENLILRAVDMREGLRSIPGGSIDVIITDPPYGVNAQDFGITTTQDRHHYDDNWKTAETLIQHLADESMRICAPQAHLYLFCAFEKFSAITAILQHFQWEVWPRPLIWVKNQGYTPKPDYGPKYHYECILFANRGRKPVYQLRPDVLTYSVVVGKDHAAQKPYPLYQDLLMRSAFAGNTVLDPFCGSAPIVEAAKALGLKAIAFDKDAAVIQAVYDRLTRETENVD